MPIGSILSKFSSFNISTADDKEYRVKLDSLKKIAIDIIGIPHLGFRNRARTILNYLKNVKSGSHVLDAGCGYGLYSFIMSSKGFNVSAIDLDFNRISAINSAKRECSEFKSIKTYLGSIEHLPFESGSFNAVICSEVIEHIKNDQGAFSELCRVLKTDGYLILSVPTDSKSNKKEYKRFYHERPGYSVKMLQNMASKNGLKIEKIKFYEYALGSALFKIHNKMKILPLVAATFYPFYALSLLDGLIKIGQPNGQIVLLKKVK